MPDLAGLDINVTRQVMQDCHSVTGNTGSLSWSLNPMIQDLFHQFYCLAVEFRTSLFIIYTHTLPLNRWKTERQVTKSLFRFFQIKMQI